MSTTNVPVYLIAQFTIQDTEVYRQYEKGIFPTLKKYQGEFVTYDDNTTLLEGTLPKERRVVLVKFPSEELALSWYNDPDYQTICQYRWQGTEIISLQLVHGLPPRG